MSLSAVHSKSLLVSSSSAGVGSFLVFLTVDSTGQACDRYGDYAAVRHTVANLTVRDLTHPFNGTDLWFAGLDVQIGPSSANDGSTASAPTRAEASHLGPGDALTLGFVDVDWRPGVAAHLNVTFSETVFADPSLLHVGDTLRFTANVQFIVDNSACFGACWSPFFDEAFNRTLSFEVQASAS